MTQIFADFFWGIHRGRCFAADPQLNCGSAERRRMNSPLEIKMTANPRPEMAAAFELLDRPADARRGPGVIVCLYPEALYLERDLLVCPPWWL